MRHSHRLLHLALGRSAQTQPVATQSQWAGEPVTACSSGPPKRASPRSGWHRAETRSSRSLQGRALELFFPFWSAFTAIKSSRKIRERSGSGGPLEAGALRRAESGISNRPPPGGAACGACARAARRTQCERRCASRSRAQFRVALRPSNARDELPAQRTFANQNSNLTIDPEICMKFF